MSQGDKPTTNRIHALLAELGIVDPISVADVQERHAEIIAAYHDGKLTEAALRHSLARACDETLTGALDTEPDQPNRNLR